MIKIKDGFLNQFNSVSIRMSLGPRIAIPCIILMLAGLIACSRTSEGDKDTLEDEKVIQGTRGIEGRWTLEKKLVEERVKLFVMEGLEPELEIPENLDFWLNEAARYETDDLPEFRPLQPFRPDGMGSWASNNGLYYVQVRGESLENPDIIEISCQTSALDDDSPFLRFARYRRP